MSSIVTVATEFMETCVEPDSLVASSTIDLRGGGGSSSNSPTVGIVEAPTTAEGPSDYCVKEVIYEDEQEEEEIDDDDAEEEEEINNDDDVVGEQEIEDTAHFPFTSGPGTICYVDPSSLNIATSTSAPDLLLQHHHHHSDHDDHDNDEHSQLHQQRCPVVIESADIALDGCDASPAQEVEGEPGIQGSLILAEGYEAMTDQRLHDVSAVQPCHISVCGENGEISDAQVIYLSNQDIAQEFFGQQHRRPLLQKTSPALLSQSWCLGGETQLAHHAHHASPTQHPHNPQHSVYMTADGGLVTDADILTPHSVFTTSTSAPISPCVDPNSSSSSSISCLVEPTSSSGAVIVAASDLDAGAVIHPTSALLAQGTSKRRAPKMTRKKTIVSNIADNDSNLTKSWFTSKKDKNDLMHSGIKWRTGQWTREEVLILEDNIQKYCNKNNIIDVRSVIFETTKEMRKDFYRFIAEGLQRPLFSVYRRVTRMYDKKNYIGKYSAVEVKRLAELQAEHHNDWILIGKLMGRSAGSVKDRCRLMRKVVNAGRWLTEEEDRLTQAVKSVSPAAPGKPLSHGLSWSAVSDIVGSRSEKQCRTKWLNYLNWKEVGGRDWKREDDTILLEKILNYTNENDIDWEKLCENWSCARSPQWLRGKWWNFKRLVPANVKLRSFTEFVLYIIEAKSKILDIPSGDALSSTASKYLTNPYRDSKLLTDISSDLKLFKDVGSSSNSSIASSCSNSGGGGGQSRQGQGHAGVNSGKVGRSAKHHSILKATGQRVAGDAGSTGSGRNLGRGIKVTGKSAVGHYRTSAIGEEEQPSANEIISVLQPEELQENNGYFSLVHSLSDEASQDVSQDAQLIAYPSDSIGNVSLVSDQYESEATYNGVSVIIQPSQILNPEIVLQSSTQYTDAQVYGFQTDEVTGDDHMNGLRIVNLGDLQEDEIAQQGHYVIMTDPSENDPLVMPTLIGENQLIDDTTLKLVAE